MLELSKYTYFNGEVYLFCIKGKKYTSMPAVILTNSRSSGIIFKYNGVLYIE